MGHHLESGTGRGAGTGRIADHSVSDRRSPNLACKMRPRHAARVQTAARRDTNGHTAERHRRPYGREPPNRPHTDTLAHGHARAPELYVNDAVPDRLGGRNPGVLLPGWSRPAALGPKAWGEEEQDNKEEKNHNDREQNREQQRREEPQRQRTEQRRTFCHRYVSAHSDASMFTKYFADF